MYVVLSVDMERGTLYMQSIVKEIECFTSKE